jgi:hypothetical protein
MKALFFFGNLFMGQMLVEEPNPELLFPVSKSLSGIVGEFEWCPPFPEPSNDSTFIKLVFRLEDRGREYLIYRLHGFEN